MRDHDTGCAAASDNLTRPALLPRAAADWLKLRSYLPDALDALASSAPAAIDLACKLAKTTQNVNEVTVIVDGGRTVVVGAARRFALTMRAGATYDESAPPVRAVSSVG